ncbi:MAG: phosphate ABC transporter permease subunit PstC [Alphaproteobacteria bacterium]|nr:phosphate ABC transporter permease subunit PstC [Alphaproteobacteria bacterium]MBU6471569.1 phosphate ABC transporter permease subunit PstC [Alphaproteobacteria bacterium]MDE2014606.1 phosphate ABC transporter permease subunit PstC [Alphaproteobacteria bacterium]MDE2072863.1 phosphate ABC transporter permease subunit PstC [Alphaproteobacteria bacterium]MDE2350458.1 phosphate ABC transporter permease subunit PstC [Alphaproteobacteria bacterium]
MVDLALSEQLAGTERITAVRRFGRSDARFRNLTYAAALLVFLIFVGIITSLAAGAWPALKTFGPAFFIRLEWNPVTDQYGALGPIYGTVVTSALAMLVAVPVGIGIAIFLTEICPRSLRRPIGIAIELLAGIPSIIYGIWGLFVFVPFFQRHIEPAIIDLFADVPVLRDLFAGPPYGIGVFAAAMILSIMILPFITAVTRDVFETVPSVLKESAYALGSTTWEVMTHVVLPFSRAGVVGGAMLALGRALGETMAVTFVIGNAHNIQESLLAPGTSISAAIANEFTEAVGTLYTSSLIAIGLTLFVVTFLVLASAQLMLRRLEQRAGGVSA